MTAPETASMPHARHGDAAHVLSPAVLLATAAAVIALTAATVVVSRIDLGVVNVAVALGIAALKASLVALFFMHLKYEHRFHLVVLVAAALFAVVFASFVLFDASQYQPEIRAHDAAAHQAR